MLEWIKPSLLYKISATGFPEELREWLRAQGNLNQLTNKNLTALANRYHEGDFLAVEQVFGNIAAVDRYYNQVAYTLARIFHE